MDSTNISFISEQLVLLTGIIGAVAALPVLIEFLFEHAKKRERIALSLEVEIVADLPVTLAGCDALLQDIADLIDRARQPAAYAGLRAGNEILIIGAPLSGKKALAKRIAQLAGMERLVTVHNPRNADALVKAKSLVQRSGDAKLMLLLPRLDLIDPREDEELLTELDALIETATERANILVIGTAIQYVPGNEIDNLFGIVLPMPGTAVAPASHTPLLPEATAMLAAVARHYLDAALASGDELKDLSQDDYIRRVLQAARNPAEIEDIVALCQTAARFRQLQKEIPTRQITPRLLETAIRRVTVAAQRAP